MKLSQVLAQMEQPRPPSPSTAAQTLNDALTDAEIQTLLLLNGGCRPHLRVLVYFEPGVPYRHTIHGDFAGGMRSLMLGTGGTLDEAYAGMRATLKKLLKAHLRATQNALVDLDA